MTPHARDPGAPGIRWSSQAVITGVNGLQPPVRGARPGMYYGRQRRLDACRESSAVGLWPDSQVWQDAGRHVSDVQAPTDADLLQRIVRRDDRALAALYDRHSRLVYSVAMRMLRAPSDAEEVLQETFVRVWSRSDTYDPRLGSPAAWLTRIARNRAIDRLRAKRVRQDVDAPAPVDEDGSGDRSPEPVTLVTPEALLQEHDTAGLVRGALNRLPAAQRTLIEAAFFDGYSHSELSQRFGVPLGTVKARIRTGLLALRSQLAHAG